MWQTGTGILGCLSLGWGMELFCYLPPAYFMGQLDRTRWGTCIPGPRVVPTRSAWPVRFARHHPNPAIPLCVESSASPLNFQSGQPVSAAAAFDLRHSSFVIKKPTPA